MAMSVWERVLASLSELAQSHDDLHAKVGTIIKQQEEILMSQSSIDNDVTALTAVLTDISGDAATLVTDLTAIQSELAAGNPIDTSALDALVTTAQGIQSSLDSATSGITGAATPSTPPPSA